MCANGLRTLLKLYKSDYMYMSVMKTKELFRLWLNAA